LRIVVIYIEKRLIQGTSKLFESHWNLFFIVINDGAMEIKDLFRSFLLTIRCFIASN